VLYPVAAEYDFGEVSPLEEQKLWFPARKMEAKVDNLSPEMKSPDFRPNSDMDFTFVEKKNSLRSLFNRKKIDVSIPEHCQGTEAELKNFAKIYKKACKGSKLEQCNLGVLYYYGGRGVVQSTNDALYWLRLSALRDFIPAQVNLGVICIMMEQFEEAKNWFERSAENGSEWGMYHLGVMNLTGQTPDNEPNLKLAFEYFKKGSKGGLSACAVNVGVMYLEGLGVPRDIKKAMKWFSKLSTFCCYADYNLALMYEEGLGCRRDIKKAEAHFVISRSDIWENSICPPVNDEQLQAKKPLMARTHNF